MIFRRNLATILQESLTSKKDLQEFCKNGVILQVIGDFALSYFGFRLILPIYTKRQHPFKSEQLHRGNWKPDVPHNKFFYRMGINGPNGNNGIYRSNSLNTWSARVGPVAPGCSVETLFFSMKWDRPQRSQLKSAIKNSIHKSRQETVIN